jgi:hypothetical protein
MSRRQATSFLRHPGPLVRRTLPVAIAAAALPLLTAQSPVDSTPPTITPSYSRAPAASGWFLADVSVSWIIRDDESGIASTSGCDTVRVSTETSGRKLTCSAVNGIGLSGSYTVTVKLDKTPPKVTGATSERSADSNGWYNHPVGLRFHGTDATSGIQSCSAPTYGGPNDAGARVAGSCTDRAGLIGAGGFSLKYDATPPRVGAVPGRPPDRYGWYGRLFRITFRGLDSVSGVARCNSVVYRGPNSAHASVTGGCTDNAGNFRSVTFLFRYWNPLLSPRSGTWVTSPPLLEWVGVRGARRYNLQLWHDGRKVLSVFPLRNRYQLRRRWTFQGSVHRLRPRRYTWYVWPRFRTRYGAMLGRAVLYVRAG